MRYTVAKGRVNRHPDGRQASITGAWPGPGFHVVPESGWRVHDAKLDRFTWHRPWPTREAAQAFADELNVKGQAEWEHNFGPWEGPE